MIGRRFDRMVVRLLTLMLLWLCAEVSGAERAQTQPAALHGEFEIGKDGRMILLPVKIGGKQIECLLDTGAGISSFDLKLRRYFGEEEETRTLKTPSGITRGRAFGWPKVEFNGRTLKTDQPIVGLDLQEIREATNAPVFGVLGVDVMRNSRVQIDFDQGVLRFLDKLPRDLRELGTPLPLEFPDDGPPCVRGDLGSGEATHFLIDTGTQGNSLNAETFDEQLELATLRLGGNFTSVTAAGLAQGERGYLSQMSIGPFRCRNQRVVRINMNSIGLRFLSRFVVTFDFPGGRLFLKKGAKFDRPEPAATSGLSLLWKEGRATVQQVKANGPADRAGIRAGDIVLQVNGSKSLVKDPFALRELLTGEPGSDIAIEILCDAKRRNLQLQLEAD